MTNGVDSFAQIWAKFGQKTRPKTKKGSRNPRNPLKSFGWGRGGRTPIHGVRVRCPSIERSPSCGPHEILATATNFYQTGEHKSNLFEYLAGRLFRVLLLDFRRQCIYFSFRLEGHRTRWTAWDGARFFPVTRSKRPRFCASSSPFLPARDGSTGEFPYGPGASRTFFFATRKSSSLIG